MLGAIDVGATKTLVAVAMEPRPPWTVERLDTRAGEGGDQLVERSAAALARLADREGGGLSGLRAIGVGVGGPLDRDRGVLLAPLNLGWRRYPLSTKLIESTGVPVMVDNDCNLGGVGEHQLGAGRGAEVLVYIGIGTGIGGGVIIGGRIHRGASGNAGELGRMIVDFTAAGDPPSWWQSAEFSGSGRGLADQARRLATAGLAPALLAEAGEVETITAAHVAALARSGDEPAMRVWRRGIAAISAAVASVINVLSPDVVVLGGGIPARAGAPYIQAIATEARSRAFGPNAEATRIVAAALGDDSVLAGALLLAHDATRRVTG
jgi:glucokinase